MHSGQHGFSLIELLSSIAAVLLTLCIGMPTLKQIIDHNSVAAIHNELIASLSLARLEALRSGGVAAVCPSDLEGIGCRVDGDWSAGWIVFVDYNENRLRDPAEAVLSWTQLDPDSGLRLTSGRHRPQLRFARNGMSQGSNLSIRLCRMGQATSAVIVSNTGRARIEKQAQSLRGLSCE